MSVKGALSTPDLSTAGPSAEMTGSYSKPLGHSPPLHCTPPPPAASSHWHPCVGLLVSSHPFPTNFLLPSLRGLPTAPGECASSRGPCFSPASFPSPLPPAHPLQAPRPSFCPQMCEACPCLKLLVSVSPLAWNSSPQRCEWPAPSHSPGLDSVPFPGFL